MDSKTSEKYKTASLLKAKGILPGGFFQFLGRWYRLTKSLTVEDISGNGIPLMENELWEHWETVIKVSKAAFETQKRMYQEKQQQEKGMPSKHELQELAFLLSEHYNTPAITTIWERLAPYDEETLRRIARKAAALLANKNHWTQKRTNQVAAGFFHNAVWAKLNSSLGDV